MSLSGISSCFLIESEIRDKYQARASHSVALLENFPPQCNPVDDPVTRGLMECLRRVEAAGDMARRSRREPLPA